MATSLKALAATGIAKKTDLYRVPYGKLTVEKGFNLRDMDSDETTAHIDSICQTIMEGGTVPPLEVRIDDAENVVIVDGHCRHAAYGKAIKKGAPIEYIDVLPFRGNDADRVTKMITAAQGLALTPLAVALGYKRLEAFNWDAKEIAKKVGRTTEQVRQLLILAHAPTAVQNQVREGVIGAYEAVNLLQKHGDSTAEVIANAYDKAKAQGKDKVTRAGIQGRALPKKVVVGVLGTVQKFTSTLGRDTLRTLAQYEGKPAAEVGNATVTVKAAALLELLQAQNEINEARQRQEEKERERAAKTSQMTMDMGSEDVSA